MHRFVVRPVKESDFDDVHNLARLLNSVNLPNEERALREVIEKSVQSFTGVLSPSMCEYMFVLHDSLTDKIVGSSAIIAQHGTAELPHYFFDVKRVHAYSKSKDIHLEHQVLMLAKDCDGLTEIGRLVLLPDYRRVTQKLGRFLSYVRFFWMAMNPASRFCERVIAELLPPLQENGQSALWSAVGHYFTQMDYIEADHASRTNKEFIEALFPKSPIYLGMLPQEAQAVVGTVGRGNQAAKHLLEAAGFSYTGKVDPFDGGPHYEAHLKDIAPIWQTKEVTFKVWDDPSVPLAHAKLMTDAMVGTQRSAFEADAEFKAMMCQCAFDKQNLIAYVEADVYASLQAHEGYLLDVGEILERHATRVASL